MLPLGNSPCVAPGQLENLGTYTVCGKTRPANKLVLG